MTSPFIDQAITRFEPQSGILSAMGSYATSCLRLDPEHNPAKAGLGAPLRRRAVEIARRVLNDAVVSPLPIRSVKGVQHGVLASCIDLEYHAAARSVVDFGTNAAELATEARRAEDIARFILDHGSGRGTSVGSSRCSPITAASSNGQPKTVAANSRSAGTSVPLPSVADVATGVIRPSGAPGTPTPNAAPNRRSSIATSVPCAPS